MKANIRTICSEKALTTIREFLDEFLGDMEVSSSEKNQIILAMDEAVANAIIHGNKSDDTKILEIDIHITDKKIKIVMSDICYLDLAKRDKKVEKDLTEIIKEKQKGGLGLKLIHTIMDIVTFYTKEDKSYLMMLKYLSPKQTDSKA